MNGRHSLRAAHVMLLGCIALSLTLWPLAVGAAAAPPEPRITSATAAVIDLGTGSILWGRDIHAVRAPASVTKIVTALVALDLAPLDRKITVQESDLVGESSMGLEAGETLPLEALMYGLLLPSGNDAAAAVARSLGAQPGDTSAKQSTQRFVDLMNAKAKALGAKETHFANPHGLDEPNHLSSAYDLAIIGAAFAANPTAIKIAGTVTYDGFGHTVHNTNKLLYDGRYASVIGGKTGQTDDAGYNLIEIANRNGRRILSVEMGTTADAFWTDAMQLLDYGFATPALNATAAGQGGAFSESGGSDAAGGDSGAIPIPEGTRFAAPVPPAVAPVANTLTSGILTLPYPAHAGDATMARLLIYALLAAGVALVLYARRGSLQRAMAEMRREWQAALVDPPHLAMTGPMPMVAPLMPRPPHTPPSAPSVSSRWAEMGVEIPRAESEIARAYALQAIRQARGGNREAARKAFYNAVSLEPKLEWGALSGFWELPATSYADLATALIERGHLMPARTMLTVAALAYPRHPDLLAVEARLRGGRGAASGIVPGPRPPSS